MRVVTTPIGYNRNATMDRVDDIEEFKKAIICVMDAALSMHANDYVHCDIRWPNIIYDPESNKYLLIDFEQIGRRCDRKCKTDKTIKHGVNDFCTPAIYDAALIIKLFSDFTFGKFRKYYELAKDKDFITNLKELKNQKINNKIQNLFWSFYIENSKLLLS